MDKTTVIHISQEEIDSHTKAVSWADAVAVPGIQKMHMACCSLGGATVKIYEHIIRIVQSKSHVADPEHVMVGGSTSTPEASSVSANDLSVGD